MSSRTIFEISVSWETEASVWVGVCDAIPVAADASTVDELMAKITVMAMDVLPDNHPELDPQGVEFSVVVLTEGKHPLSKLRYPPQPGGG